MTEIPGDPRIRPARLDDATRLADLATQLGYPSTPGEIAARLRRIQQDPCDAVLVADIPGRGACGFAHLHAGMALESGPRAELVGLVTDASLRSRGLGSLLVAEAERWARAKGLPNLCVRCNVVRADAHRFYQRLGFQCSKTQKYFRKSLAPLPASENP
ncbi:MAG TPA: GNAT family N-acetyltransferase [Candidatus Acidoferrales bacterium]|nr:GNAT family N-acetyltransferase [Candidatus Acidoferrales bacterium]